MNTMKDLRREVRERLHDTLDGKEIDMMDGPTPRLPHMIGVTSLGAIHTHHSEDGTLFDPDHEFWQEYEEEVNTPGKCKRKIESAVRSLKEDDIFRMTYPYGEEADIVYCEVTPTDNSIDVEPNHTLQTSCPECETELHPSPSLDLHTGSGRIKVSVNCDECEFSAMYEATMHRL
jgi:predicted nucleic-acid-binding Zn-ribbon protein